MTGVQYFHFCAELWGAIFCIVAAACAFMIRYFDKSSTEKLINLMMCACMLMLCDAFAWWYRGDTSPLGYQAVRAANFFAFVFQSLQYTGQTTFKALGKKKQAIFFSLFRKVVMVVPLTLLLPGVFHLGADGVFMAEPISNVVGGTACMTTMLLTVLPELKKMDTPKTAGSPY